MAKGAKTVAKAKAAGVAASSGKSRKAAEANPFSGHDKLAPDEIRTVAEYQEYAYESMNAFLRGVRPGLMSDIAGHIPKLDRIMTRATIAADTVLYRGMKEHPGISFKDLRPGDVFEDKGFHSTSTRQSVAEKFVGVPFTDSYAMFKIKAPKGSHGLAVHQVATGTKYQSGEHAEHEVLLPRGSTFRVEKVSRRKDGNYSVTVRLQ